MPEMQVMQVIIATARLLETDKFGSISSTALIEAVFVGMVNAGCGVGD
jgi:hypothetical protein